MEIKELDPRDYRAKKIIFLIIKAVIFVGLVALGLALVLK